ncbi:isochorismatase family protein [Bradyrhizobium manausense]|uniref:isochorismatase family protein n=1 Tax=Bradyrhizobium manausense TaxID=989370 RepID=UPI001BA92D57|nr:isochorismatase family protein [Bradyrhizobium manausense]MBR0724328.1 isochorismatase family protein [Bradyrhizobium manausense]
MTHVTLRSEFETLIDPYAPVAQVGTGFDFTEGPIWHPLDNYLLFSDMPGDVRRRWDARRGVAEVKRPSNKCNGMTYDAELNLIVCEHATSSLIRERPDGRREVLASHFGEQELNSPNDVCVHSSGAIYFSDPWYGRMPVYGVERPRQLGFQGVYRVMPGSEPKLVVDRTLFDQPNGLCFSPDETLLYVNDTVQALVRAFDVNADGTLSNARVFASGIRSELEPGLPDGMKCDQHGNVWVTAPGGVWVYSPHGDLLGKVRVPELVANLAWGGADFRTLYLTSTHSVYAIPTKTGPRHEPYMTGRRSGGAASTGPAAKAPILAGGEMRLDPSRCAMIIQDLQNDVIMDGGAFAESGAPAHAKQQHVVENVRRLAEAARARGIAIIHVWFVVEPGAPGVTLNAPLFEGLVDSKAMVRGSWGAAPVSGLEPRPGDFVVEKMRMSAWEGTRLETILKATGRDMIINTGAWTNMSVEHTARTGADKGYFMIVPEDCCSTMNADWHAASINFAMQNVAVVTRADAVISALG